MTGHSMQMVLWGVVIVGPGSTIPRRGGLWGIGVLIAYPCKGLSLPPGLIPVHFSTCALTFSYILFPYFHFHHHSFTYSPSLYVYT